MCENPYIMSKTALQRLEHRLLAAYQRGEGRLEVDDKNAYFRGNAIPLELWRQQAFAMGLPPDTYLDIAALAGNAYGAHQVSHGGKKFVVEVSGLIESRYGQHRQVSSVTPHQN